MADIELVIKIPEELLKNYVIIQPSRGNGMHVLSKLLGAIKNGIPLPKGHGKIIDSNEFNHYLISRDSSFKALIAEIPPIIEADKESE